MLNFIEGTIEDSYKDKEQAKKNTMYEVFSIWIAFFVFVFSRMGEVVVGKERRFRFTPTLVISIGVFLTDRCRRADSDSDKSWLPSWCQSPK